MLFSGHKIPIPSSAPVQPVPEEFSPFLKSVTKHIKILPAANLHNIKENEIDTTDKVINVVNDNESLDDIILELQTDESFERSQIDAQNYAFDTYYDEDFDNEIFDGYGDNDIDSDVEMDKGRDSNKTELSRNDSCNWNVSVKDWYGHDKT